MESVAVVIDVILLSLSFTVWLFECLEILLLELFTDSLADLFLLENERKLNKPYFLGNFIFFSFINFNLFYLKNYI